MSAVLNIEDEKCVNVLKEMYNAQVASFFADDAMPKVMDKLGLSEEEAMEYLKYFLEEGLIKKPALKPAFFFRPGFVQCFPVTLTARGLSKVKTED
jgi:hypothetical protein